MSLFNAQYDPKSSHSSSSHLPGRLTALITSILVALASGTPYLYGVYSPQFVKRIGLLASHSSTISIASNLGSGVGGYPGGLIIDRFGPQKSILLGSICIFMGYFTLHKIYDWKYDNLFIICLAMISAGFGSITSYFATLKASQANFPKHRGAAGSFPVSAYGFAATVFSIISATFFNGDTGGLLEFLAIFCGSMTFIGSFFIHIYLDHNDDQPNDPEMQSPEILSPSPNYFDLGNNGTLSSSTAAIEEELSLLNEPEAAVKAKGGLDPATPMERDESLKGSISFWGIGERTPRASVSLQESEANTLVENLRNENNAHSNGPSWLNHWLLQYIPIPKCSSKKTARYSSYTTLSSPYPAVSVRCTSTPSALQVSIISIGSFSGRLLAGFLSDFIHKKWHIQRLWIVQVTLVLMGLGQYITLINVNDKHLIAIASAMIGGSYGLIFGTYPAVIADGFGTKNFSSNWGLVCTGPLITLWVLNKLFGEIYDSKSENGVCYLGNECYLGAFELSLALISVTFVVTLILIYIQRK
ncbi:hypothetical protein Cantr_09543 [Candida viswanathii]|uniref:Uncharacterized protein n=1 Tax=Candida viswanathii TaxID=5486 RepID=A0A367YA95_9ASCO|nr:hypothetical protein Cantr_09543 [Candida viswanathii]